MAGTRHSAPSSSFSELPRSSSGEAEPNAQSGRRLAERDWEERGDGRRGPGREVSRGSAQSHLPLVRVWDLSLKS